MIYVNLTGRLGNQLFIFEKLLSMLSGNESIYINVYEYQNNTTSDGKPIRYDAYQIIDLSGLNVIYINSKFLYSLAKAISNFQYKFFNYLSIRHPHHRHDFCLNIGFFKFISGYFQSVDRKKVLNLEARIIKKVNIFDDSRIAIHYRQGDYLTPQHSMHYVVTIDSIFNFLLSFNKDTIIDIFSDSNVDHLFEKLKKEGFVVNDLTKNYKNDMDVFYALSSYKNIFCSNSSFSWWAAHLFNLNKNVYLPSRWMDSYTTPIGLIMDRDIKYDV